MSTVTMSDQFNELASTTLRQWTTTVMQNQVFNADPLSGVLLKKNKKLLDGGVELGVPLMIESNDTAGSSAGYDKFDNTPQDTVGTAVYNWKKYYASVVLDNDTIRKNSGKSAVIKLLEAKAKQASMSLEDKLATDLYGDGTGNDGKEMLGLAAIVSASGTLAGISRTTYSWWQAQSTAVSGAVATSWMRTLINNVRGSGASANSDPTMVGNCDLIITTQDIYEDFEALVEPYLRIQGTATGELGYESLKYKGAEVTWSDKCTSGCMYFLSTKHLALYAHENCNFITTPFKEPIDQDAKVAQILVMLQLTTDNPRRLGVASSIT